MFAATAVLMFVVHLARDNVFFIVSKVKRQVNVDV